MAKTKFPIEGCRERIARKWGLDAVALSGPCEGASLADCVCQQLEARWDDISKKLASDEGKAIKVAMALAESFAQPDESTTECVKDLESIGYENFKAAGIADYMKAYAMDKKVDGLVDEIVEKVAQMMPAPQAVAAPGMPQAQTMAAPGAPPAPRPAPMPPVPQATATPGMAMADEGVPPPMADPTGPIGDEMVDMPLDMGNDPGGMPPPPPAGGMGDPGMGGMDDGMMGDMVTLELPVEVAQELADMLQDQLGGLEPMGGDGMGDDMSMGDEGGDGDGDADDDFEIVDEGGSDDEGGDKGGFPGEPSDRQDDGGGDDDKGGQFVDNEKKDKGPSDKNDEESCGSRCASHGRPDSSGGDRERNAAMDMRAGKLRRLGQSVLKLGPEMSINNTDQQAGHSEKQLGKAKEKSVEEPKPINDGNWKTEGYSAGDKKVQDHGTLGHEQKFEAHTIGKDEYTGGNKSLMGKDESFPEGKPQIPAGSAAIGNEPWSGGDISTKGTVIAEIVPDGIRCVANGRAVKIKANMSGRSREQLNAIASLLSGIPLSVHQNNAMKFAEAAKAGLKKLAEESGGIDGVTKIDTAKLEAEKFTNDGDKKPEDGGAMTSKGKSTADEDHPTYDGGQQEAKNFTNDAEKKPEGEKKAAYLQRLVKEAMGEDPQRAALIGQVMQKLLSGEISTEQMRAMLSAQPKAAPMPRQPDMSVGAPNNPMTHTDETMQAPHHAMDAVASSGKQKKTASEESKKSEKENVVPHHEGDKKVSDPKAIADGNLETEGYSAGDKKFQDHGTLGHEQKFEAKTVSEGDVSGGSKSLMGKDESFPEGKPEIPAGGGKMGEEEWDGGNVNTKGTVIANENRSQNRESGINPQIREARLKAASVYLADALRHGEVSEAEYTEQLEKLTDMPVQAIVELTKKARHQRAKIAQMASQRTPDGQTKVAGLGIPLVVPSSSNELSLKDRIQKLFTLDQKYSDMQ